MPDPKPSEDFELIVVTPDKVLFESRAKRLIAPGIFQDIAILPDHTPLYSELKEGELDIIMTNDHPKKITIESGVLRCKQNRVSVITGF